MMICVKAVVNLFPLSSATKEKQYSGSFSDMARKNHPLNENNRCTLLSALFREALLRLLGNAFSLSLEQC